MAAGGGSGFRSQPPSLQPHMLPPTPQPATPRAGPQTPASVGPIGSVGGGDYGAASVGGPGSVNPATPRSVGEPLSVSDQQQQQMMAAKSGPLGANSSFAATLLDQDSNSQIDSPQQQQQQQQSQSSSGAIQQQNQQALGISGRTGITMSSSSQNLIDVSGSSVASGGRGQNVSGSLAGSSTLMLQNVDQIGPLALCSMGKELTQELVNRTADMFMMLRGLTDPSQQVRIVVFLNPLVQVPFFVSVPKNRSTRSAAATIRERKASERQFAPHGSIGAQADGYLRPVGTVEQGALTVGCPRSSEGEGLLWQRIPLRLDIPAFFQELLPYLDQEANGSAENGDKMEVDKKLSYLDEIRLKAEQREEYQSTLAEYEKTKQDLMKKREHLKQIMEFLRDFCWQISMVLDSNASPAY